MWVGGAEVAFVRCGRHGRAESVGGKTEVNCDVDEGADCICSHLGFCPGK